MKTPKATKCECYTDEDLKCHADAVGVVLGRHNSETFCCESCGEENVRRGGVTFVLYTNAEHEAFECLDCGHAVAVDEVSTVKFEMPNAGDEAYRCGDCWSWETKRYFAGWPHGCVG
jgi:predicted RNA-binding Zn-ribbon protein involved in translation (DUF1610 family)